MEFSSCDFIIENDLESSAISRNSSIEVDTVGKWTLLMQEILKRVLWLLDWNSTWIWIRFAFDFKSLYKFK